MHEPDLDFHTSESSCEFIQKVKVKNEKSKIKGGKSQGSKEYRSNNPVT